MNKASFVSPSVEKETIESLSQKLLEVNLQLTEANRELKRVQSEKEEMLSNISHDLRAPITAIRSALDYLNSGQEISMEDYIASLQLIDRRTQTLENLIQDMYYLFCVEDTSRELELVTLEAAPFLEEYFYDMISDKRYDDHDMVLDLPENLSCKFSVDVQKMIRVLDNLFTNAAKYSGTGSRITLQAGCIDNQLQIRVIDNGPGIPEDALPHIFRRTYTVSHSRTPGSATGSGLGLSIAKAIVERLEGSICCTSEPGEGCCFLIQLPCI
jgi:signal transduction histidine kinase